ncbi:MAG: thiamine monophosphate synthase [Rhodobacterales bacterium CG15_BIG_FIL_POST_REV_8_21_14_020_59_13]|nr:MAG: thiamine monophosphate synthase [Rhodobacterales bacterium CG15_BIG_FIL_POST_REV_8_21_14_020_59_13]
MSSRTYSQAMLLARLAARWPGVPGLLPPLIALTDPVRTPDVGAFARDLPEGCALIYRHFGRPERFAEAGMLAQIAREKRLVLLIAADPDLADACDADGVHWPVRLAGRARKWRRNRAGLVLTMSAHNRRELAMAKKAGADAALLSPVFATRSHEGLRPLGAIRASAQACSCTLPVYALGGITADTAKRLSESGFSGLAAIEGLKR